MAKTLTCVIVTMAAAACDAGTPPEAPIPAPTGQAPPAATNDGGDGFIWKVHGEHLTAEIVSLHAPSGAMALGGHFVPIAGTSYVVRVTDGSQRFDVYSTKLGTPSLRQQGDTLFIEAAGTGLGEPPQGETHSYEAMLVRWDTAQHAPVVVHEWTCTTSSRPKARDCVTPSWANASRR